MQLPPTILSAKQKVSEGKVKVKPLDFPETSRASGPDTPAEAPTANDTATQPTTCAVEAEWTTGGDAVTVTPVASDSAADAEAEIKTKPSVQDSAVLNAHLQRDSVPLDSATEQLTPNTGKSIIDEKKAQESINGDLDLEEKAEGTSSDEPVKDDMREENNNVRRTRLEPPRSLETTMFDRLERMFGAGIKRLLSVQYR